jgi:hypothetical protein
MGKKTEVPITETVKVVRKPRSTVPSRLKTVKKPKATGAKGHFKSSVLAKRRKAFYSTGKGSVGLLVRFPRLVRHIRKIRKDQNARYAALGGLPDEEGRSVIFKSFPTVIIGAVDAYAGRIMELAAAHAESRRTPDKGLKLRVSDLEFAVRWISKISNE